MPAKLERPKPPKDWAVGDKPERREPTLEVDANFKAAARSKAPATRADIAALVRLGNEMLAATKEQVAQGKKLCDLMDRLVRSR